MLQLAKLSPKDTQGLAFLHVEKELYLPFRIALVIVCHSLAIPTTAFRLLHRIIGRRLWWDDFWAAFGLINEIMLFAVYITAPMGIPSMYASPYTCLFNAFILRFSSSRTKEFCSKCCKVDDGNVLHYNIVVRIMTFSQLPPHLD